MHRSYCRMAAHRIVCLLAFVGAYFMLAGIASAFTPQTGHWWNPNESGTGYNIDVSNGVLVITIYSYKPNGDAEWYLASGPLSADQRHFSATLDKYRNGQCISCPYTGRPGYGGSDGTISIEFSSATSATVALPGGRVTRIQPFFLASSSTKVDGTYQLVRSNVDYANGYSIDTADGTLVATGTMVIAGNQISQNLTVVVNGTALTVSLTGTFTDFGPYVVVTQNGVSKRVTIVARSPVLITESLTQGPGTTPTYAEVDQWVLVSQAKSLDERGTATQAGESIPMGAAIGSVLKPR
jgi:hypothetical protein